MKYSFSSMGCAIVVGGADARAPGKIENLFEERDRIFSRFRAESELNRVNDRSGRPQRVSKDFATMLALALDVAQQTDGLVDPTFGAALEAAGYDRDFAQLRDDGDTSFAGGHATWREVALIGNHVFLPAGVRLDLNGVVKSKTVDDAVALLPGDGFVSAGGDIAVRGGAVVALPSGGTVQLVRGALATSGTDRRRWLRGGRVQHHLIDPRTGRPSCSRWSQVTACGVSCVAADIAAKAGFLLDDDGPAWLDERGIPGRFVDATGPIVTNTAWSMSVSERVCT